MDFGLEKSGSILFELPMLMVFSWRLSLIIAFSDEIEGSSLALCSSFMESFKTFRIDRRCCVTFTGSCFLGLAFGLTVVFFFLKEGAGIKQSWDLHFDKNAFEEGYSTRTGTSTTSYWSNRCVPDVMFFFLEVRTFFFLGAVCTTTSCCFSRNSVCSTFAYSGS